jgi:hypothetical protein
MLRAAMEEMSAYPAGYPLKRLESRRVIQASVHLLDLETRHEEALEESDCSWQHPTPSSWMIPSEV